MAYSERTASNYEALKSTGDDSSSHLSSSFHSLCTSKNIYRLIKSAVVVVTWICMGLWSEITGPTLPDLVYRTHSSFELVSWAISMRGAGSFLAVLAGLGYILDRFHSKLELITAVAIAIIGGLNIAKPYSFSVYGMFPIFALEGYGEAFVSIAGQVVILDLWDEKASGPLHVAHFGFGVGGILIPYIMSAYISKDLPDNQDAGLELCTNNNNTNTSSNGTGPVVTTNLPEGFILVSSIIIATSVLWVFYSFYDRKQGNTLIKVEERSLKESINPNTCYPGKPFFAVMIYVFMFLWIFVAVAGEQIFGKYIYAYARSIACFEKSDALNLYSIFWITYSVGRFLGFIASIFIHMKYILFCEGFLSLASAVLLYCRGDNPAVLWICTCASGLFIGPVYPSGLAWANQYMIVTPTGVTVMSLAEGISKLMFLFLIGAFIDSNGLPVVTIFIVGFGVAIAILPIAMTILTWKKKRPNENT